MSDWFLGQAGFGEQVQLYGDAFWRQMGSTVLWTFLAIWGLLVVVAIVVALSRHADVNEEMGGAHRLNPLRKETRTGSLVLHPRAPRAGQGDRTSPPRVA